MKRHNLHTTHVIRLAACLLLAAAVPASATQYKRNAFSVTLTPGWQDRARAGHWTPLEVMVGSRALQPFIGYVEVSHAQDYQHRLLIRRAVVIPPGRTVRIPLISKLDTETQSCRVTLIDQDGDVPFRHKFDLRDRPSFDLILPQQLLLAVTGRGGLQLSGFQDRENVIPQAVISYIIAKWTPIAWTGYCGLDGLVLYDPNWSELNYAQVRALADWVSNGGKITLILATHAVPPDNPIGQLIPFKIGSPQDTPIGRDVLAAWKIKKPEDITLPVWRLPGHTLPAGWRVLETNPTGAPLRLEGHVGFGKLIITAFDPNRLPLTSTKQHRAFWTHQLPALIGEDRLAQAQRTDQNVSKNQWMAHTGWTAESVGINNILSHLMNIRELEPISVWWVLAVLGVLAVLIGPVDYLVLKRLKRLPWTYFSFAGVLAVFTVGAYFGVEYLRAGRAQVRRVCVVDKIAGTAHTWQTGYTGVFAPRSDEYELAGVRPGSWWSGIAPARDYRYYGEQGMAGTIPCVQQNGNMPTPVPINIWSMRTLLDEGRTRAFPLTARVTQSGNNIRAEITNTGTAPLTSGLVRLQRGALSFNRIDPGQTVTVEGRPHKHVGSQAWFNKGANFDQYGYQEHRSLTFWQVFGALGICERTEGIECRLQRGAAVVYATTGPCDTSDITIDDRSAAIRHTALFRLVIPRVTNAQNEG